MSETLVETVSNLRLTSGCVVSVLVYLSFCKYTIATQDRRLKFRLNGVLRVFDSRPSWIWRRLYSCAFWDQLIFSSRPLTKLSLHSNFRLPASICQSWSEIVWCSLNAAKFGKVYLLSKLAFLRRHYWSNRNWIRSRRVELHPHPKIVWLCKDAFSLECPKLGMTCLQIHSLKPVHWYWSNKQSWHDYIPEIVMKLTEKKLPARRFLLCCKLSPSRFHHQQQHSQQLRPKREFVFQFFDR